MEKSLAEKYELGSYVGVGIDDPGKYLRFSTSPAGMESMMIKDGKFQFIEPAGKDNQIYKVFNKPEGKGGIHGFECDTNEHNFEDIKGLVQNGKSRLSGVNIAGRPTNTRYRTFRLAMAATREYTQFHGGQAGAIAAINNTVTRINGIFERDFGAHLVVQDIPEIIFTDAFPYFNMGANSPSLNLQLQQYLTWIENAPNSTVRYDIGHVFHWNGNGSRNGNAGAIGSVCTNPVNNNSLGKGSAYSMSPIPVGEEFDLMAAHEMGHQLGANHTFSMRSEGSGANVEPGGGTTIMAYPGITQDNVQNDMDGYFHYKSIAQVLNTLESKNGCGTSEAIANNTAPAIRPLTNYSIPKGTAYYLDAVAEDRENDQFTYTWEQYDSVGNRNSISGDSGWGYNTEGALARSLPGTVSGRRYFPKLESVMDGVLTNKSDWETVSYVPRELHYAVTLRDENAQRPMTSTSETVISVRNDGPFKFDGLTNSSILYNNATNTVYWDTANTNAAPYNVANVKIDYTTDNGITWTDLVASTPNTGSYSGQMPANLNGPVKLRISAIGNIFYAVSPAVTVGTAPTSVMDAPTGVSAIDTEIFKTRAKVSWNKVPGATYSINYRKEWETNWLTASSQVNSIVLNNLEDETNYEVRVASVVNNIPGAFSSEYILKTKGLKTGVDYCLMATGGNGASYNSGLYSLRLAGLNYVSQGNDHFKTYLDLSEDRIRTFNLTIGQNYDVDFRNITTTREAGVQNDWLEIWIDYNRNGTFENSEKVVSNRAASNAMTPNQNLYIRDGFTSFTVPDTAYSGEKTLRMRVASTFFNQADGPCGSPMVATANGGIVSAGTFRDFSVRIINNNGARNALIVNESTKVNSEVSIYPNPADTVVEVKNLKGTGDYKIYSADGRLVQEGKFDGQKINVGSLIKGMYVVAIKDEKNTYNMKLMKK